MEKFLFTKKIDKSFLKDGLTIPLEKQEEVSRAVGAVLTRGSRVTVDIYVGEIAYPAILTHVNMTAADREIYQIRYSAGSDICRKINELFGEGTGTTEIEVWADDHRHLIFLKAKNGS